ncbi:MAG: tRNA (adenosine(37)-N6)-threonylcarbamoyltransferase complex dimerization subunit type 1 TsaB [Candidatus Dormibacteria bacterium]
MTVLAIDTSARRRIVCLRTEPDGEIVSALVEEDADVDRALPLALASLSDGLTHVVVVVGPGSYTGVRAGMAAALGVAHARGLPLHGAGSLDVVVAAAGATGVDHGWALVEAGRGAAFAARFNGGAAGQWARVELDAFVADDRVYSADALTVVGLHRVDPVSGLARAIPAALARPPLRLDALQAMYPA